MSTFVLDGYGFDCQITEVPEGYSLEIDHEHVITMPEAWKIIELLGRGETGHDGWDEAGDRAVPPFKSWRCL